MKYSLKIDTDDIEIEFEFDPIGDVVTIFDKTNEDKLCSMDWNGNLKPLMEKALELFDGETK